MGGVALVGGASAPMPSAPVEATWHKSIGAEAPPTKKPSHKPQTRPVA
ncbi:DUF6053 domain-containing protein [Lysobacter enzymogenes]